MKYQTGSRLITVNVWSDAAREAALAARGKAAEGANSQSDHREAADYHDQMWGKFQHEPQKMAAHEEASLTHTLAAKSLQQKGKQAKGGVESRRAREASKRAHL